jgi:hypothetical protein
MSELNTGTVKHQPHIMVDVVDPIQQGTTYKFQLVKICIIAITVLHIAIFFISAIEVVKHGSMICLFLAIYALIAIVAIPKFWHDVAGTQLKFDTLIDKINFYKNVQNKTICKSKYDPTIPEESIREVTGLIEVYEETGLVKEEVNQPMWSLKEHPYLGQHSFNLIADPKFLEEDIVFIENMFEANKNLPSGCLKNVGMICGQMVSNILEDIEHELSLPNLSKVREDALYSILNQYSGRNATFEPIYIIHIGLPFTESIDIALENMQTIRNEFEKSINEKKIHTVLIKDSDVIADLTQTIYTGFRWYEGDVIEN